MIQSFDYTDGHTHPQKIRNSNKDFVKLRYMTHEIHNTWGEFRTAFGQILSLTRQNLCIFDDDLGQLGLQQTAAIESLQQLLANDPVATIHIALRHVDRLREEHPRLVQLLALQSHRMRITQIPETLQHLRDAFVVADAAHVLARFELEQPRHAFILDDNAEAAPYAQRFADIWALPGTPFLSTVLGL
jgi:Xaa-Pro aminopeptidase